MNKLDLVHMIVASMDTGSPDDKVVIRNLNDDRTVEDDETPGEYEISNEDIHDNNAEATMTIGFYGPVREDDNEEEEDYGSAA